MMIKEFCYKYDATVGPSSRRWRRPARVDFKAWSESDPNEFFRDIKYEELPMVDITMPEDRFRALMEHDRWVEKAGLQDNQHFQNNVSRVSHLIVEHERECRLRQQHPALQTAWEQYQVMLAMVDDGR